jgi:hypothetical protein
MVLVAGELASSRTILAPHLCPAGHEVDGR